MIQFVPIEESSRLYIPNAGSPAGAGFLAFLLLTLPEVPPDVIGINDSWNTHVGFYLFMREQPAAEKLADFIDKATAYFNTNYPQPTHTGFSWMEYEAGTELIATTVNINNDAVIERDMLFSFNNYTFPLKQTAPVQTKADADKNITGFTFEYPPFDGAQAPRQEFNIQVSLTGETRGTLNGQVTLADLSTNPATGWDASLYYNIGDVLQRYPLFNLQEDGLQLLFNFRFDPVDQLNYERSYLAFSGMSFYLKKNSGDKWYIELNKQNQLPSYFRTVFGKRVDLIPVTDSDHPARLVFEKLPKKDKEPARYYMAPMGDFELAVPQAGVDENHQLVCGLSGVEKFSFTPAGASSRGDVLRFVPGQNANGSSFPITPYKAVAETAPVTVKSLAKTRENLYHQNKLKASAKIPDLLTGELKTSWINIRPFARGTTKNVYYSQPDNAALYRHNAAYLKVSNSLLHLYDTPSAYFDSIAQSLPMVPYAGVKLSDGLDTDKLQAFENQILVSARRNVIAQIPAVKQSGGILNNFTTPQGLLAKIAGDGIDWREVELAKSTSNGKNYTLGFVDGIKKELREALQSNELFMVATAAEPLGNFNNTITIADWPFNINVGKNNEDGSPRNILIFKFGKGKINDKIRKPESWTNAETFNNGKAASVASQLGYFIDQTFLDRDTDPCFNNFLDIIENPNWNGILALQVDIGVQNFPEDLKGLLAGIDRSQFFAHHMGIEVNLAQPNDKGELAMPNSSLFGVINYVDKGHQKDEQVNQLIRNGQLELPELAADIPGAETPDEFYEFKVLAMQLIFENSDIKNFTSKIQLTTTTWFGEAAEIGNGAALKQQTIEFNGTYEKHNDVKTYTFLTEPKQVYKFMLKSQTLNYVEIVKAQFNTLKSTTTGKNTAISSRFSFWGYMNFKEMDGFDLLSFGDEASANASDSTGLYFANLAINMNFNVDDNGGNAKDIKYTFDPERTSFDLSQSTPREQSFFQKFPIKVAGLTFINNSATKPANLGFLPIKIEPKPAGTEALTDRWYSLIFNLNLGSMGALASKAGFVSQIAVSWSPDADSRRLDTGIKLPLVGGGQKALSLQSVLNLEIENFVLKNLANEEDKSAAYQLYFKNIKLSMLGLKLPTGGNIQFTLFGNTQQKDNTTLAWYAYYAKN